MFTFQTLNEIHLKMEDNENSIEKEEATETERSTQHNDNLVKVLKRQISILEEEISQNKHCWIKVESLVEELDKVRKDVFEEKITTAKLTQQLLYANQKDLLLAAEQESYKNRIALLQNKLDSQQSLQSVIDNKSKENISGDDMKEILKEFLSSERKKDAVSDDNEVNKNVKELEEMKTRITGLEQQACDDKDTITNLKTKSEIKNERINALEKLLTLADNRVDNLDKVIAIKNELLESSNIDITTTTGEERAGAYQVMPSTRLVNQNDYLEMKEKLAESQSAYQALNTILDDKDRQISDLNNQIETLERKNYEVNN